MWQQHELGVADVDGWGARHLRTMRFCLVAALIALICFWGWPCVRRHVQAMAVLRLVGGQSVPRVVARLVMVPVRAQEIHFSTGAGVVRARMYLPVGDADAPGLVVLHGVHYLGIDEPRLINFAAAMASCGLRVLTPEMPGIKDYHIDPAAVGVIGDSVKWFAQKTGAPVGVMGLSFSGGLALVAASEPAYKNDFKFVFTVGAHDSMARVANYYMTGLDVRPNGTDEHLKPNDYGALVLEYEHLRDFLSAQDDAAIRPVLRDHLYEDPHAEALAETKLTTVQRTEAMQLMDAGSPATSAEIAKDDTRYAAQMAAVSPDGRLGTMTTPVFLLAGKADDVVPSAETLWLAKELPRRTLKAMLISPVLSHVNLDEAKPKARDEWRLVHFFALVLQAAERKSERKL